MFEMILDFFLTHIFLTIIFVLGCAILLVKFLIWLFSYMITEIIARVYVNLNEEYNLKLSFIQSSKTEMDYEELEDEN